MLDEPGLGEGFAGIHHEVAEQPELCAGEAHRPALVETDLLVLLVQHQIVHAQFPLQLSVAPP